MVLRFLEREIFRFCRHIRNRMGFLRSRMHWWKLWGIEKTRVLATFRE